MLSTPRGDDYALPSNPAAIYGLSGGLPCESFPLRPGNTPDFDRVERMAQQPGSEPR